MHEAHTKRSEIMLQHKHMLFLTCPCFTEYLHICRAVAIGFAVMGFIGYFVKLIHIPMYVALRIIVLYIAHSLCLVTTSSCTYLVLDLPH